MRRSLAVLAVTTALLASPAGRPILLGQIWSFLSAIWSGPSTHAAGFGTLAGPNLLHLPEWQASEPEVVGAVLRWLREHPGWLLILDNVDTKGAATAVRDILPFLSGGRVLLTSRLSRWPPDLRKQELETMTPDDAVRFLLQRTETEGSLAKPPPLWYEHADSFRGLASPVEAAPDPPCPGRMTCRR